MNYHVGIDLGGTNIAVGIVDDEHRIVARGNRKTNAGLGFQGLVKDIAETAKEAMVNSGIESSRIVSVGVGTPSCVNPKTGRLVNANNLGWIDVPLKSEIQQYFEQDVKIANDADCAALGEVVAGAASEYDNAIMVTLGTGVGGGIIINRRIYSGADGMGSEIGHTKLIYGGERCTCGKKGCFEAYASATALIRQAREAMTKNPESILNWLTDGQTDRVEAKTVFGAAHEQDKTALQVLDTYLEYLVGGISTLITLYRPQAVIIGGGISRQGEYLLKPLREKIMKETFAANEIGIPVILTATLGNDAGIIGAARLGYMQETEEK